MVKKAMKVTKKQKNNAANDINELHICISKDQDQLEKLYNKTIISVNKNILSVKKTLAKAKQQAIKAKRNAKAPKAYQSALSEIQSLQKQLNVLKEEYSCIEAGYSKFNAQQKSLLNFEKEWAKKVSNAKKKPMKRRNIETESVTTEVASQIS